MSHLSPSQFTDAATGAAARPIVEHLERCDACRAKLADLQSTLEDAGLPAPGEPSPLFWEHFSQRVRAATDGAAVPRRMFRWRPVVLLVGLAGAVVLAVVLRHNGTPLPPGIPAPVLTASTASDAASADDDTADIVSAVSGDLSFDEARAADLVPSRAGVALAVDRLSEDQKRELLRIVREELGALQ